LISEPLPDSLSRVSSWELFSRSLFKLKLNSSNYTLIFSSSLSGEDSDKFRLMFLFSEIYGSRLDLHTARGSSNLLMIWYLSWTIFFRSFLISSKYFLTAKLSWFNPSSKILITASYYSEDLLFSIRVYFYF
jgi:hypothetical protein